MSTTATTTMRGYVHDTASRLSVASRHPVRLTITHTRIIDNGLGWGVASLRWIVCCHCIFCVAGLGSQRMRGQVLYVAGWGEMKRVREGSEFNIPRIKHGQHMPSNLISFSVDISYLYLESGRPIKKGIRHSGALKLLQSLEIAFVQVMRLCRNSQKVTEARESVNHHTSFGSSSSPYCIV